MSYDRFLRLFTQVPVVDPRATPYLDRLRLCKDLSEVQWTFQDFAEQFKGDFLILDPFMPLFLETFAKFGIIYDMEQLADDFQYYARKYRV